MAQFNVHRLASGTLVVDCQSDFIQQFDYRLVIPLISPGKDRAPVARLEPLLAVGDQDLILTTHLAASVSKHDLGKPVDTLAEHGDTIKAALDLLIYGF